MGHGRWTIDHEAVQKYISSGLQAQREDLAREALKRKKEYENKARKLEKELEKLAIMTENLLQNHINS